MSDHRERRQWSLGHAEGTHGDNGCDARESLGVKETLQEVLLGAAASSVYAMKEPAWALTAKQPTIYYKTGVSLHLILLHWKKANFLNSWT